MCIMANDVRHNVEEHRVLHTKVHRNFLVKMLLRSHLFPYRTQKLSSMKPTIVGGRPL